MPLVPAVAVLATVPVLAAWPWRPAESCRVGRSTPELVQLRICGGVRLALLASRARLEAVEKLEGREGRRDKNLVYSERRQCSAVRPISISIRSKVVVDRPAFYKYRWLDFDTDTRCELIPLALMPNCSAPPPSRLPRRELR